MCFSDIFYGILYMYISSIFLKLGESIYVATDLIPILLGSLPLAHNAQHSLVIGRAGASPPSRITGPRCLYLCIYPVRVLDTFNL